MESSALRPDTSVIINANYDITRCRATPAIRAVKWKVAKFSYGDVNCPPL